MNYKLTKMNNKVSNELLEEIEKIKKTSLRYVYRFKYREVFDISFGNGWLRIEYKDYANPMVWKEIGSQKCKFLNWLETHCCYLDYIVDYNIKIDDKLIYIFLHLNN